MKKTELADLKKMDWFPLYVSRFISDTAQWEDIEVGVYFRLLCTQWINGYLLDDEERLRKLTTQSPETFKKIWSFVKFKFTKKGEGRLQNEFLELVRDQQQKLIEKKSMAGKLGAAARWDNIILPFPLSKNFRDAWELWLNYKKTEHRFTFKSRETMQIQMDKLLRLANNDEQLAIDHILCAIESTWKGFFPITKQYATNRTNSKITAEGVITSLQSRYK